MRLTITDNTEDLMKRLQNVEELAGLKLKVGLPPSAGGHLRFILGIQEHGAPIMRIPSRKVVDPALENAETRHRMAEGMKAAVKAAWEDDPVRSMEELEKAGQAGADGIRKYIDAGISPPNSPVTVSGGWIFNRVARKGVLVKGKGFNKPIYDTGELYNAFGYVIEE